MAQSSVNYIHIKFYYGYYSLLFGSSAIKEIAKNRGQHRVDFN